MSSSDLDHPPVPPLALRVGVTGHKLDDRKRSPPDIVRLRRIVREVLGHVSDAFDGVAQVHGELFGPDRHSSNENGLSQGQVSRRGALRIVSALAEGADQWIADEALRLGYELQCALPFPRAEYESDFPTPDAKTELHRLLGLASVVLELDGRRETDRASERGLPSDAYLAAGRAVLTQSDLLLAIWDGEPPQGRGGTGEIVVEALQRGIPVVWVSWDSPDTWVLRLPEWRLVQRPADIRGDAKRLKEQVHALLAPPRQDDHSSHASKGMNRREYLAETEKSSSALLGWWQLFLWVMTGEILRRGRLASVLALQPFKTADVRSHALRTSRQEAKGTAFDSEHPMPEASSLPQFVEDNFLPHYAWANHLSIYYANLYRSSFVLSYLMAAWAVFFALIGVATGVRPPYTTVLTAIEIAIILTLLCLTLAGRRSRWHERWIDYRTLAERLRLSRSLALLGGSGTPQIPLAGHLAGYGNPSASWMHWHCLAIERAAGLCSVGFTSSYMESCRTYWVDRFVEAEIRYHALASNRYDKIERNLHLGVWVLFVGTLIAGVLHLDPEQALLPR